MQRPRKRWLTYGWLALVGLVQLAVVALLAFEFDPTALHAYLLRWAGSMWSWEMIWIPVILGASLLCVAASARLFIRTLRSDLWPILACFALSCGLAFFSVVVKLALIPLVILLAVEIWSTLPAGVDRS